MAAGRAAAFGLCAAGAAGAWAALGLGGGGGAWPPGSGAEPGAELQNWSGTHRAQAEPLFQPETVPALEQVVARHHRRGEKLRAVGNRLSPNGLGLSDGRAQVSPALLDGVLYVDRERGRVTVQAGATVGGLLAALRPYGLTLANLASIADQQLGGFTQVGAHGTGAGLPPVDEQVVALKLVTPGRGTLALSADDPDPSLFRLARCGLGGLGVVSEVTLQCVPAHQLTERTFVSDLRTVRKNHARWLREHRHLRYMWLPHTKGRQVVVVTADDMGGRGGGWGGRVRAPQGDPAWRTEPLRRLLSSELAARGLPGAGEGGDPAGLEGAAFSELRDRLLALAPLDAGHIARVNAAEAEFWRRSSGERVAPSDQVLGFDCGGQQWVLETAFPTGTLDAPSGADLDYMERLLDLIEERGIAAPAPIEQRWTASSSSPMSPASAPGGDLATVHSWVGIIMYLPPEEGEASRAQRAAITAAFREYCEAKRGLDREVGATEHWAKLEVPEDEAGRAAVRGRLAQRFPAEAYGRARAELDPKNVLGNAWLDAVFPHPARGGGGGGGS